MYFCRPFIKKQIMYLKGILIIIGFLALGNAASLMLGNFIPGSVCGMVLLFAALAAKIIKADEVRPVADFLTKNMSLFFVPASIGIMEQWGLISSSLIGWVGVILISTLLVLISVGGTQSCLMRAQEKFLNRETSNPTLSISHLRDYFNFS